MRTCNSVVSKANFQSVPPYNQAIEEVGVKRNYRGVARSAFDAEIGVASNGSAVYPYTGKIRRCPFNNNYNRCNRTNSEFGGFVTEVVV